MFQKGGVQSMRYLANFLGQLLHSNPDLLQLASRGPRRRWDLLKCNAYFHPEHRQCLVQSVM
jgi:hypothetical protein